MLLEHKPSQRDAKVAQATGNAPGAKLAKTVAAPQIAVVIQDLAKTRACRSSCP